MRLYPDGDPRARALLSLITAIGDPARGDIVRELLEVCQQRGYAPANIDFALAALAYVAEMPADAGETLFSIARLVGWTAHALEELEQPPLRFRTRAVYTQPGPAPSEPHQP
jgi:citrate synthase